MLNGSTAQVVAAVGLVLLLLFACITDVRSRRIPNRLVALMLVAGVLISTWLDPLAPGLLRAVAGTGVALAIWLPGWLFRMMGAGDVKLFAAAGAWLGPAGAVNAALVAAVTGGMLALLWMVVRRGKVDARRTLWVAAVAPRTLFDARKDSAHSRDLLPYSLAITVGVMVQLAFPGLVVG